MVYYREFSHC